MDTTVSLPIMVCKQQTRLIGRYREVVLSPQKIHISQDKIVWSCASFAQDSESFSHMFPTSIQHEYRARNLITGNSTSRARQFQTDLADSGNGDSKMATFNSIEQDLHRAGRLEQWYDFVPDYQRRKVTLASDRLPAISAIALDMMEDIQLYYYMGIWIQDVTRGLAWSVGGQGVLTAKWRAPSWSWASLECSDSITKKPNFFDNWWDSREDCDAIKVIDFPLDLNNHKLLEPPASLRVQARALHYKQWPKLHRPLVLNAFPTRRRSFNPF